MDIIPINNWLASRERKEYCTLVLLHATAGGSFSGALQALRQRELSYNFIIEKNGVIRKCVPYKRYSFHAGNSYGPREEARGVSTEQVFKKGVGWIWKAGCSVNSYSVSISFVNLNDGLDGYTVEQYTACAELIDVLIGELPLEHISTHFAVSPKRKSDPRGFQVGKVCGPLTRWKC